MQMMRWESLPRTVMAGGSLSVRTETNSCRKPHGVPMVMSRVFSPKRSLEEEEEHEEEEEEERKRKKTK